MNGHERTTGSKRGKGAKGDQSNGESETRLGEEIKIVLVAMIR